MTYNRNYQPGQRRRKLSAQQMDRWETAADNAAILGSDFVDSITEAGWPMVTVRNGHNERLKRGSVLEIDGFERGPDFGGTLGALYLNGFLWGAGDKFFGITQRAVDPGVPVPTLVMGVGVALINKPDPPATWRYAKPVPGQVYMEATNEVSDTLLLTDPNRQTEQIATCAVLKGAGAGGGGGTIFYRCVVKSVFTGSPDPQLASCIVDVFEIFSATQVAADVQCWSLLNMYDDLIVGDWSGCKLTSGGQYLFDDAPCYIDYTTPGGPINA